MIRESTGVATRGNRQNIAKMNQEHSCYSRPSFPGTRLGGRGSLHAGRYEGLLYKNEVFTELEEGMHVIGYIKKLRDDERIDVSLQPQGFKNVIDSDTEKILQKLKEKGFLLLTDKSSPEAVKFQLQMSKKAFKRAIGTLYKKRMIEIKEDRIELTKK